MSFLNQMIGRIVRSFMERGAKNQTYAQLDQKLQESGEYIADRMRTGADTPKSRQQARHLIGIEKWGQRRLQTALGEPLVMDEYDGYQPSDQPLDTLLDIFLETRKETHALLRRLQETDVSLQQTVPHNDMGEVTVGGWLFYFAGHGKRESGGIKPA